MQVRKAVITAAAPDQNRLPLQQLVDRDGDDKTALQLIVEETLPPASKRSVLSSGRATNRPIRRRPATSWAACDLSSNRSPGYADAILRAKSFVGDDPFLHLVGDHLYLSATEMPCAKQLVQMAERVRLLGFGRSSRHVKTTCPISASSVDRTFRDATDCTKSNGWSKSRRRRWPNKNW